MPGRSPGETRRSAPVEAPSTGHQTANNRRAPAARESRPVVLPPVEVSDRRDHSVRSSDTKLDCSGCRHRDRDAITRLEKRLARRRRAVRNDSSECRRCVQRAGKPLPGGRCGARSRGVPRRRSRTRRDRTRRLPPSAVSGTFVEIPANTERSAATRRRSTRLRTRCGVGRCSRPSATQTRPTSPVVV